MSPSFSLFIDPVTLRRRAWVNVHGVRTPMDIEAPAFASVQPRRSDRVVAHELPVGSTAYVAYFPADPALLVDDEVLWRGRTLKVLAPARDQAGRGLVWAVDLVEER